MLYAILIPNALIAALAVWLAVDHFVRASVQSDR